MMLLNRYPPASLGPWRILTDKSPSISKLFAHIELRKHTLSLGLFIVTVANEPMQCRSTRRFAMNVPLVLC